MVVGFSLTTDTHEPCGAKNLKRFSEDSDRISQLFSRGPIMSENVEKTPVSGLNPSALALADAARLLSKVGGQAITAAMLHADIAAGAPTNANGTLNLVHYAAWLVQEMGRSAEERHGD